MKAAIRLIRVFAVATVVLLAACASDGSTDPVVVVDNGSIQGTVTDDTGATVANATVELTGNAQAARSTSSGANGVYTFADVPPGTYALAVTPPSGFTIGGTGTFSVTVESESPTTVSAIVLDRVILNGSIRGTVIDIGGDSVANAGVALSGNGQALRTTISGADGVYTFADVPPGTYGVAITPPPGFSITGSATKSVTVANETQAIAHAFVLLPDSCLVVRPDFGGPATEEDRALFAYDVDAPLNLQETVDSTTADGVKVTSITYDSPAGGSVTGILVEPVVRPGLRAGIVLMHPSGMTAKQMAGYAQLLASRGAVVIAIDAPYFRRGGNSAWLFTDQDRTEHIQLIQDLQRAVDVLLARSDVDPARIGFEGYSYGGIGGATFVGVERRLEAAVFAAAHGGHVTGATTAPGLNYLGNNLTCAARTAWFRAMVPLEGIRFMGAAAPTELLFQIARFDSAVLLADAETLYNAASDPKEVLYYDTGHGFNAQAIYDRGFWLHQQLGIDAPSPLP